MPRDLRLLAAAVALSAAGDMLLVVVLALRVHDLTGSGFAVSALFGALMLPVVLLAPFAGRLVDRVETRRVLLASRWPRPSWRAGLVLAGGLAPILVLTALLGAGAAIAGPAEAALVPATIDEDRLAKANGWVETARYAGFTAGPLLAGLLTALGGTGLGLAANAASFAAVALAATLLHARRHPTLTQPSRGSDPLETQPSRGSDPVEGGRGLRLLLDDPVLRPTLGAAVAALVVISAVDDRGGLLRARRGRRRGDRLRDRVRRLDAGMVAGRGRDRLAHQGRRSPWRRCSRSPCRAAGSCWPRCGRRWRSCSPPTSSAASGTASRTSCCAR